MIYEEERFTLKGREIVLRSARVEEAQMLIDYLKTVTGETRFLMCEPDEVSYTLEEEENFIKKHNESPDSLFRKPPQFPSRGRGNRALSEVYGFWFGAAAHGKTSGKSG